MPAQIKITKRAVDGIASDGADRFYWDRELPGFGLRVRASGRKYFVAQFRAIGKLRRMTLGPVTAMTPEEARKRAMALLAEAKAGSDPAAERDADRKAATVKALGRRFLDEYVPDHCKASTAYEYRRSVELFVDPRIGNRKVTEIQRSDIAELHHGMRKTPYQANRTLGVLSKMFNMAEVWGLRPDGSNPCLHVKRFKEEKRERFLTTEELARLGKALDEEESFAPSAVTAFRLLLYTGARLSEIQTLKWEHIRGNRIHLPDSKTGAKTIPLNGPALEVLAGTKRIEGNPYVITGTAEGAHLTDLQKPWRRVRKAAELEDVRIHDLRHTFASEAVMGGESLPMVGRILGHTQAQTTARYAHLADDPLQRASERIALSLKQAMSDQGKEGIQPTAPDA